MPGSRFTYPPNRSAVMLFWAAISLTVGPGAAAWAGATASNAAAAAVHPAIAIAALRTVHRGRFMALLLPIRRGGGASNTGTLDMRSLLLQKDKIPVVAGNDSE